VLGMTTSGLVQRDSLDRTLKSYHPFFTAGASTAFVATLPPSTPATATAYDVLDRATLLTHPDAQTETTTYALAASPQGALQFKTQHTINMSPTNRVREQYADHLGQMRAFVEHPQPTVNATTTYDYFPTGELKQIVDAEGNKTNLAYDLRGLRTSFSNPDTGTHQDIFDLMGNRITTITPNLAALGAKIDFVYDRNQLVKSDYPSKTDVSYKYGPPGAPNFAAGRLLSRTDETGTIEYAYGALGETRETHRILDGPGIPATDVIHAFTFDSLGRQLELKYPDGEHVTNTYDAAGMLSEVKGDALYATGIRYDVFGNRTRMAIGKVVTTWSFDPARVRLLNVTSTLQAPGLPKIQNLQYTYDPAGNPKSLVNTLAPSTGKMPGSSTSTFTYDGVDRLVDIVGNADVDGTISTSYHQTFTYSASHNLLAKSRVHTVGATTPPATNFSSTYTYATRPHLPDIVGGLKITYDASGNPIVRNQNGQDQKLIWDDDDRLVDLTDEATDVTQHNAYDAVGLRVLRVTDGPNGSHTTVFASPYFDVEDGTNLKHIFAGGTRVATYVDDALYFLHSNHLGSTGVVSDADGNIHQSLEYFADGETWIDRSPAEPINGYLFNGKPFDPETGFYDFGQRFYDPRTSLWLGVDPAFTDAASVAVGQPSMLAQSAFAGHSPAHLIDPDGRCPRGRCEPAVNPYEPSAVRAIRLDVEPRANAMEAATRTAVAVGNQVLDHAQFASNFLPQGRVAKILWFVANEVVDYLQGQSSGPVDPTIPGPKLRPSVGSTGSPTTGDSRLGNLGMLSGSGPVPGVIEVSHRVKSVAAFKNYNPATRRAPGRGGAYSIKSTEFVFDPVQSRFAVGKPHGWSAGSPHQRLAASIDADPSVVVGGMFRRGPNGEILTNERSGHYWRNWTPEIRSKFEKFMKEMTGLRHEHLPE
jgi:RHS repeat-associated protein